MHKLTVFAVTALLCLALLAGAAPVAAQSSTDVRILREARDSYNRAIALANTAQEAQHIRQHLDRLAKNAAEK